MNLRWFRWYFVTRGLGATTVVYELLVAGTRSPERGTLIIIGFAAVGIDFVTRAEGRRRNGS